MNHEFGLSLSSETIREYALPYMLRHERDVSILKLKSCGISVSQAAGSMVHYFVDQGEIKKAAEIADGFTTHYASRAFRASLTTCFLKTLDVESFLTLLHDFSSNLHWISNRETENEEITKINHREFVGETIENIVAKLLSNGQKKVAEDLLRVNLLKISG